MAYTSYNISTCKWYYLAEKYERSWIGNSTGSYNYYHPVENPDPGGPSYGSFQFSSFTEKEQYYNDNCILYKFIQYCKTPEHRYEKID
jgi:hypothetical protein